MSTDTVSPLRPAHDRGHERAQALCRTQRGPYPRLQAVRGVSPGGPPKRATAEDIRPVSVAPGRGQLEHLYPQPDYDRAAVLVAHNAAATGILPPRSITSESPQKVPLVMSPDETKRLWPSPSNLKVRMLLSLGYAAACVLRSGQAEGQAYRQWRQQDHFGWNSRRAARTANVMLSPRRSVCCAMVEARPSRHDAVTPATGTLAVSRQQARQAMTTRQLAACSRGGRRPGSRRP